MGSIVEDSIVDEHANKDWRVVKTPSQARVMTSKSRLLALRIILARLDLYSDKEDGRGSGWTPGAGMGALSWELPPMRLQAFGSFARWGMIPK